MMFSKSKQNKSLPKYKDRNLNRHRNGTYTNKRFVIRLSVVNLSYEFKSEKFFKFVRSLTNVYF